MSKENLRMQMLAGIITEGQYKAKLNENVDIELVKKYHSILEDIGDWELAGDLEDIIEAANGFDTFSEFLQEEFNTLEEEDPETVEEIKNALRANGIKF
jgi:hypothetical protein